MRAMTVALSLLFSSVGFATNHAPTKSDCAISVKPEIIFDDGERLLQVWTLPNDPIFWSGIVTDHPKFWSYRRTLQSQFDISPMVLMANGGRNEQLLLSGQGGQVKPITCIESILLAHQMDRADMLLEPTEFVSSILKSGNTLKVFYYTVDQAGIGSIGWLAEAVQLFVKNGWRHLANVQNHNFFIDRPDISGFPSPSIHDVQAFRGLKENEELEQAWVTNGFHTGRIRAEEFGLFEGP